MKIINPYKDLRGGQWLRGNLHAHTTLSDGRMSLQEVIDVYAGLKHDFLMISDHNVLVAEDDYRRCDNRGLILISGNEVSDHGPDLLHVGAGQLIAADQPRQAILDAIAADGGFAVMNHPNIGRDFNHCSFEDLIRWHGYVGIEIHNGSARHTYGSNEAIDKWERVLASGRCVWGFANDDSHEDYQVGLAWNAVYAHERSWEGIESAFRAGRFYASSGVVITDISVTDRVIRIETQNAQRIAGMRESGVRFCQANDRVLEVEVQESSQYVRFECWGPGEQKAWTQPFFIKYP